MNGPVKLPPDFDLQSNNAAIEWKFWKNEFEDYLMATGQHEAQDKVKLSILRNIIGGKSTRIMSTFDIPEEQRNKYDYMIEVIDKYVNPRVNEVFERYNFLKRTQKEGETFDQFLTECKYLIKTCNYNISDEQETPEEKMLRDKIVIGIKDPTTREALLRIDKLTLDKAINFCRTSEQSRAESLQFQEEAEVNVVNKGKYQRNKKYKVRHSNDDEPKEKFSCRRCQRRHGPRECPAYKKKCTRCGIENHFAVACRVKNIREVQEEEDEAEDHSSSSEIFVRKVEVNKRNMDNSMWEEKVSIEGKEFKVKLDTGSDVNVIPSRIFKDLKCNFKILPTNYVLKAFEGTIAKPVGIINLNIKYKDQSIFENFVIVDGVNQILIGGQACLHLNLIKRVNEINVKEQSDTQQFLNKNIDIFSGTGRLPGNYVITTSKNFEPVCHPPTRIPLALREPVKNELDRLIKRNAIIKVENINPNASINRMVIVEKHNGKIRLCLDPSDLNKQIVRKPQVGKTMEEICSKLLNKKIFSVFDLSEGYHQLQIDEESSWKCCFSTPFGIYRFLVLPYGLSNSQDLFQEAIEKYFGDIKNLLICHDDIIIAGKDQEEHDRTITKFIERARTVGVKFNKEKVQYNQTKVKFMGQCFSERGMEIDEDRIEALCKLESPKNKTELQRILGSFNYVRKYVTNMAEYIHPLCELLKNNIDWQWLPKHQECFDKIKEIICKAPALTPFDPKRKIVLQCDASSKGIGCCLFQVYDKLLKLVACSSRSMNDHEVNYSQTEKELLAIYYGTQKFHDFLYHSDVDVQTDHKPIIAIMEKPICKIGSIRLQRLRLKLFKYSLKIYYVPGKHIHFADMLSRSSLPKDTIDMEMFDVVHTISRHLPMSDEKINQFRKETSNDTTLNKIIEYYYNGWPKESKTPKDIIPYYTYKNDIYVEAGIIFMEDKIIVPKSLQKSMIEILHKGHIGICKTDKKAKSIFFWPKMKSDIIEYCQGCRTCEKFMPQNVKEPMLPHEIPKLPFNKIGADILEFTNKNYLILVDYYSHWIELNPLTNKTAEAVIDAMQNSFSKFGYPQYLMADNLPFLAYTCKEYYKKKDITILTCTPHYHQSNGLAEKAVSICKQNLRKGLEDRIDIRELMFEYNNSPIISLGA